MSTNVKELTDSILHDKDLVARLENAESAEELSALLAEKGVEISPEKIDEVMAELPVQEGELSESDLEAVAGGKFKWRYLNPFYWVGRLLAAATTKDMC